MPEPVTTKIEKTPDRAEEIHLIGNAIRKGALKYGALLHAMGPEGIELAAALKALPQVLASLHLDICYLEGKVDGLSPR